MASSARSRSDDRPVKRPENAAARRDLRSLTDRVRASAREPSARLALSTASPITPNARSCSPLAGIGTLRLPIVAWSIFGMEPARPLAPCPECAMRPFATQSGCKVLWDHPIRVGPEPNQQIRKDRPPTDTVILRARSHKVRRIGALHENVPGLEPKFRNALAVGRDLLCIVLRKGILRDCRDGKRANRIRGVGHST